jgi:hypothetical protein
MAMRKRSLKTSFEITGPDALFHMMSIRFRSDTIYSSPDILHHTFKNMTLHAVKWLFCNHY